MGVNEIACLIDFGVSDDEALDALGHLPVLQAECAAPELARASG
jgi:hypothetical protein